MKITKRQLKKIIREEKEKLTRKLTEAFGGGWSGDYGGQVREGHDVMQMISDELGDLGVNMPPHFWDRLNYAINDVEKAVVVKCADDPEKCQMDAMRYRRQL